MTTLLEQINRILVPHKHLWDEMTKEDVVKRKEEWKKISHSLKVLGRIEFRGSYMKAHKELFMKGFVREPFLELITALESRYGAEADVAKLTRHDYGWHTGGVKFAGAFPLFYMWYLPRMDDQLADEIIEHFTGDIFNWGGRFTGLCESRKLLWERFPQGNYKSNGAYGAIGPRLAYIAPRLIGEEGERAIFDQRASEPDSHFGFRAEVIFPKISIQGLLSGKSIPEHTMGRYIWKQGSWYLKPFLNCIKKRMASSAPDELKVQFLQFENVIQSIEMLLFFAEHPKSAKDNIYANRCCGEVLAQYRSNHFSPEMNALFKLVESNGIGNTSVDEVLELI